jgi:hypothetical protein
VLHWQQNTDREIWDSHCGEYENESHAIILTMGAACTSETSVYSNKTTQCYIPKGHLQNTDLWTSVIQPTFIQCCHPETGSTSVINCHERLKSSISHPYGEDIHILQFLVSCQPEFTSKVNDLSACLCDAHPTRLQVNHGTWAVKVNLFVNLFRFSC